MVNTRSAVAVPCGGIRQLVVNRIGAGISCEFFLLVLPCGAEIALQVGVLFQLRIAVGRQHLAVGIDVDALALGLLQQQL